MITAESVTTRFPEFSSVDGAILASAIADADGDPLVAGLGDYEERAKALLTAHLLFLRGQTKGGSRHAKSVEGLSSFKSGEVSLSFRPPSKSGDAQSSLSSSRYGSELWDLLNRLRASGGILV